MLLQPASSTPAFAKIGIFGPGGSGKTLTSILLAIGLSKKYHNSAPISMQDTDNGSEFIEPICRAEGVPLLVAKSRTFVDMRDALKEAESVGACVHLVDSYTHPYKELVESLRQKLGFVGRRIPFQHQDELKSLWDRWVREMQSARLHVMLAGRLGHIWDEEEDESGDPHLVKLGNRMRGEGDAGYEPNLLIEMEGLQDKGKRETQSRFKKGSITHAAYVLKDRTLALNGRTLSFKDLNDYKPGGYQTVFNAFLPHFERLNINASSSVCQTESTSSVALFSKPEGESAYAERHRRITIAVEELKASLEVLWPGRTDNMAACRTAALEALFGTRSMSAIEHRTPETVEAAVQVLKSCERQMHAEDFPTTRPATIAYVYAVQTQRAAEVVL